MEEPDRLGGLGLAAELNEGKPPRAAGLTIGGQVDLDDAAGLGQKLCQGVPCGPEVQVPDEDASWNGVSPFGSIGLVGARLSGSGSIGQEASRRAARSASAAVISSANMPAFRGHGGTFASTYWQSD